MKQLLLLIWFICAFQYSFAEVDDSNVVHDLTSIVIRQKFEGSGLCEKMPEFDSSKVYYDSIVKGKEQCISHLRKNSDGTFAFQSNEEHQQGVANLAKQFASEFGMADWGYFLGMIHDKGKERGDYPIKAIYKLPGKTQTNTLTINIKY